MDRASISNVQKVVALFRGCVLPLPWGRVAFAPRLERIHVLRQASRPADRAFGGQAGLVNGRELIVNPFST